MTLPASHVIAEKGFDPADGILRVAIRDQVGDIVKRLYRRGEAEKIGRGRGIWWRLSDYLLNRYLLMQTIVRLLIRLQIIIK
jgi:hypothetical protein